MRLKWSMLIGTFSIAAGCCVALPAESAPPAPTAVEGTVSPAGATAEPAPTPAARAAGAAPAGITVSSDYVLQPGDELEIAVWKETDLTQSVFIRPDGGISFPLAGDLPAAGRSVAELTAALEKRIRRYEPDAVVTVMVKSPVGNRVYVIGKVNKPGDFALNRPIDVMQALSLAGGATPFANTNHIRVLRREGTHLTSIAFRYGDVQRGRRLDQNILLKSGDTVVVP
jgi:polysaccharide export outer membrane protein